MEYLGPVLTGAAAMVACLYTAFSKLFKERRVRIEAQRQAEMDALRSEWHLEQARERIAQLEAELKRSQGDRRR